MSSATDRLELYQAILTLIEERRSKTGDDELGSGVEKAVLDAQFRDLEGDILENPGALEPWLVRRRPIH